MKTYENHFDKITFPSASDNHRKKSFDRNELTKEERDYLHYLQQLQMQMILSDVNGDKVH